jgi:uncharacterized protein involved in type VI secretion and phage assembly
MSDTGAGYYGKYRGIVVDNNDPDQLGRIKAIVPSELEQEKLGWALPCVPYAGNEVGLFLIPPKNASVWIEFENGDLEKPIWSGCFWSGSDSLPLDSYSPDIKVLKTKIGTITINDSTGSDSITIETTAGMKIEMTNTGIEITNGQGKIKWEGPKVAINDTALEVT